MIKTRNKYIYIICSFFFVVVENFLMASNNNLFRQLLPDEIPIEKSKMDLLKYEQNFITKLFNVGILYGKSFIIIM